MRPKNLPEIPMMGFSFYDRDKLEWQMSPWEAGRRARKGRYRVTAKSKRRPGSWTLAALPR